MKTKHTKGEWFVSGGSQIVSMPSQCKITNHVSGRNEEESEANIKLISAAPELLEAAIISLKHMQATGITYDNVDQYNIINKAIKKATE